MVTSVGTHEAASDFSDLLKRVQDGERFLITDRGVPVAQLVPVAVTAPADVEDAIAEIKSQRNRRMAVPINEVREMIQEGRS